MQRIDQRVGVFVDVQNMYYSARALFDQHVNFGEILKEAVGDRRLIRAFAYVIQAEQEDESSFFDALKDRGFELRSKPIQNFRGGNQKGDWDIGIAMDIVQMLPKLDAIVLVSGDGDFAELLKYVKSRGVLAEVMAFGSSASGLLRAEADALCDLAAEPNRFLLPKKIYRKPIVPSASTTTQTPVAPVQPVALRATTPVASVRPAVQPRPQAPTPLRTQPRPVVRPQPAQRPAQAPVSRPQSTGPRPLTGPRPQTTPRPSTGYRRPRTRRPAQP